MGSFVPFISMSTSSVSLEGHINIDQEGFFCCHGICGGEHQHVSYCGSPGNREELGQVARDLQEFWDKMSKVLMLSGIFEIC